MGHSLLTAGHTGKWTTCCRGGFKVYKGKRPQSRRLTAGLFINAHYNMKEKREVCCFPGLKNFRFLGIDLLNGIMEFPVMEEGTHA
eukprot:784009-Pelagomonas_calceolata.AAC.1